MSELAVGTKVRVASDPVNFFPVGTVGWVVLGNDATQEFIEDGESIVVFDGFNNEYYVRADDINEDISIRVEVIDE